MKALAKLAYHIVTVIEVVAWMIATITMGVAKLQEEMASTASTACVQSSKLSLLSREKIWNESVSYKDCSELRVTVWYLVVRLLQRFLNEAQDETRASITQQAVRKKKNLDIMFKRLC